MHPCAWNIGTLAAVRNDALTATALVLICRRLPWLIPAALIAVAAIAVAPAAAQTQAQTTKKKSYVYTTGRAAPARCAAPGPPARRTGRGWSGAVVVSATPTGSHGIAGPARRGASTSRKSGRPTNGKRTSATSIQAMPAV